MSANKYRTVNETNTTKCLRPDCDRYALTRGLCASCYQTACKMVRAKLITMNELEKTGKILPAKRGGPSSPIADWLLNKPTL